jgi:hypothetical protein
VLGRGEKAELRLRKVSELAVEEVGRRDVEESRERFDVTDRRVVLDAGAGLPEVG